MLVTILNLFVMISLTALTAKLYQSFQMLEFLSITHSLLIVIVCTFFLFFFLKMRAIGPITVLGITIYLLPFVHILPYPWFDFETSNPEVLWGLHPNPYMLDQQTIQLLAMIGAMSFIGFIFACSLSLLVRGTNQGYVPDAKIERQLPFYIWFCFLFCGVFLSFLFMPADSVFTARYTESLSIIHEFNFPSAWLLSYIFLGFCFADAFVDKNIKRKTRKNILLWVSLALIILVFQFARGDRESVTLLVAIIFSVYYKNFANITSLLNKTFFVSALGLSCLLAAFYLVGVFRSGVSDMTGWNAVVNQLRFLSETGAIDFSNVMYGTWSAVLLTPLSVAGDYVRGLLEFQYGDTYIDLLLSIPPGFVADFLGYERPINSVNSPAWEMTYGIGGWHATVVPFMNFGLLGVLVSSILTGVLFIWLDRFATKRNNFSKHVVIIVTITVLPHWFWYGDKIGINAFIMFFLMMSLYRLALFFSDLLSMVSSNHRGINVSSKKL